MLLTVELALNKPVDPLPYRVVGCVHTFTAFRPALLGRRAEGAHGLLLAEIFELAPRAVSKPGPRAPCAVGAALDAAIDCTASAGPLAASTHRGYRCRAPHY